MQDKKALILWLLQRVSALLILIVLALHLHKVHYADMESNRILFADVTVRLKTLLPLITDSALLFLGLFHGLNGVRMVALDYGPCHKYERIISWGLFLIGILFFIWGIRGLWAFLNIR